MNSRFLVLVTVFVLARATCFGAVFMDLTGLAPGTADTSPTFTGTLNGVAVLGTFAGAPNTTLEPVAPGIGFTTIINDSPQWSYPAIYTPTSASDDRVGFSQVPGAAAVVTIAFSSPMTDLIFHVANLDFSALDFSPTIGLTGVTLLSGNGGAGDGIAVGGPTVFDMAPATADGTPITSPPPTTGTRSAYGSVLLSGTYTSLNFSIFQPGPSGIDNVNFTLSVPEPGRTTLAAMALMGMLVRRRRRLVA